MKRAAVAIGDMLRRIGSAFGIEGAWLAAGTVLLSVGAYLAVSPIAPWFVVGGLCVVAWLALTTRRAA